MTEAAPTRADEAMTALLEARGRRVRFTAGELIQQRGDAGDGFWLVAQGEVTVCRFGRDGELTVFAVLGPGDLFGELAHFSGVPRQVDAVAESAAELIRIDAATITHLLAQEPDFARWLLGSLANQLRLALDRIEGDRTRSAASRLAQVLLRLAARGGPEIVTTQQNLADLVGVSRVTAGQALARLARAGAVKRGYGRIVITNAAGLAEAAG